MYNSNLDNFIAVIIFLFMSGLCVYVYFNQTKERERKEIEEANKRKKAEEEKRKAEQERWNSLSPLQQKAEREEKERNMRTQARINQAFAHNLPVQCPSCNEWTDWRKISSEKIQNFDSAVRIGGYTQINVKETEKIRYKCSKCGYEMVSS